ncbi:hypothetical protein SLS58_010719 [Diplodia intermedia]|uniref:Uncharacterized protein n=1 Tax=Diplodia intermedia TaxID=856260 RepID=A0ABR3T489_9PEZI
MGSTEKKLERLRASRSKQLEAQKLIDKIVEQATILRNDHPDRWDELLTTLIDIEVETHATAEKSDKQQESPSKKRSRDDDLFSEP